MTFRERWAANEAAREVHRAERLMRLFASTSSAVLAARHVIHREIVDTEGDATVQELAPDLLKEYSAIDGALKLIYDRLVVLDYTFEQARTTADTIDRERRIQI